MNRPRIGAALLALAAVVLAPAAAAQQDGDIVAIEKDAGPANGFPTAFTPEVIKDFDTGMRAGVIDALREGNRPVDPDTLTVSTERVRVGTRDVLRSRVEAPSTMFMVQYAGIIDGHVFLVVCVSRSAKPFDPAGTACEQQVQRTYAK